MQIKEKEKIWEVSKLLITIIILYILLILLLPSLTSDEFKAFTRSIGILGPLIVISYIVFSHIFAPLAGSPGVFLGIAVYGIHEGMIYLYFASMISACINFYIGRNFGRDWVTKLVGKKAIKEIDNFTKLEGSEVLIICRLFGFPLFDFISYGTGLTNIPFKNYIIITAICGAIPNIFAQFAFKHIDLTNSTGVLIWYASLGAMGVLFTYFVRKYIKERDTNKVYGFLKNLVTNSNSKSHKNFITIFKTFVIQFINGSK